uniref:Uncharacterized protein n=1 Tax=Avena sativa TaxID=4498 RepID=A0ACD5ZDB6_AVESA
MAITLAVVLLLLPLTIVSAQEQQPPQPPPQVVRPGCRDKCGNITIPYPFGIGDGCYRDDGRGGFQLECDDSHATPWLTTVGYGVRITNLSIATGEVRAKLKATRYCHDSDGAIGNRSGGGAVQLFNSHYLFSPTRNRLVTLGCPNHGYFVDLSGYYVSGCMSICRPLQYALPGSCTGVACCQSAIPSAVDYYEPYLLDMPKKDGDPILYTTTTTCRYVFLVETGWLSTRYKDVDKYLNQTDDLTLPIILDWAVRNVGNCSAASLNRTDYACQSADSHCVNSTNGAGYQCNCSKGYEGNPYLEDGCRDIDECKREEEPPCYGVCTNTPGSYTCQCPPGTSGDATWKSGCRPKDSFTFALKVVTGVSLGMFLPAFMCFWLYLGVQKRKLIRTKQKFFELNGGVFLQQQMRSYNGTSTCASGFNIFSKEDLEKATDNFAADRVVGRGGHGIVYKGILEDKTVVAIKKSKMIEEAPTKEFAMEMFILSQINHKNVVKLLGCCLEVEVPMLVYEFVSNGTLYHYIHGSKGLDSGTAFETCLRIAVESAEALAYMHSSASPPILHGDVKTANILLDDKLTAKVSDFGASKLAPTDEAKMATLVQGTCGYLDPEYLMTCRLTDKSDVYSFGVVLLELLTRKKALYFDGPEEDRSLVLCFMMAVQVGQHQELLDSQLRNEMSIETLEGITLLIMRCLNMSGQERPAMKEVAERLEMLRRYQYHPWAQADANTEEEAQSLLDMEQRNVNYKFTKDYVLDFEGSSTYSFSS